MSSAAWQEIRVRSGRDDKFARRKLPTLQWMRARPWLSKLHLDRSAAEWRDLRFLFGSYTPSLVEMRIKRLPLGPHPSRPGGPPAKRQPSPEGLGWNPPPDPERHRRGTLIFLNESVISEGREEARALDRL